MLGYTILVILILIQICKVIALSCFSLLPVMGLLIAIERYLLLFVNFSLFLIFESKILLLVFESKVLLFIFESKILLFIFESKILLSFLKAKFYFSFLKAKFYFSFLKAKFYFSFFDLQNLLGFERAQHQSSSRLIKDILSLFSFFKLL